MGGYLPEYVGVEIEDNGHKPALRATESNFIMV